MKTCPFCAEEILDEAVKCKHCGSMIADEAAPSTQGPSWGSPAAPLPNLPQPDVPLIARPATGPQGRPSPTPAPAPAAGGPTFTHNGQRYILGYGADFYGIWDRLAPGPPVVRYPRTDQGWQEAWRTFISWEPHATGMGTSAALPTNGMAVASLVLGVLGLFFFWVLAIPPLLALVFGYQSKRKIEESNGAQGGSGLALAGIVTGWVGIGFAVLAIVSASGNASGF